MAATLSILIPAYNYLLGIENILTKLEPLNHPEIEIIVFDDSNNSAICQHVNHINKNRELNLTYHRNIPALGAVFNWNSLLKAATGEFLLLLHHDEFPLTTEFVSRTIQCLKSITTDYDVLVMQCILTTINGKINRPHLPFLFRKFIVSNFPTYIFKRNVIGPTSCLIVRKSIYPKFDTELKWLVDVETYYRLRLKTSRWYYSKELEMGSTVGRMDSITYNMKDQLCEVYTSEKKYLSKKYCMARNWLDPELHPLLNFTEELFWIAFRMLTIAFYKFMSLFKI